MTILRVGLLIVSDTAYRNPSADAVRPVLKEVFSSSGKGIHWVEGSVKWEVAATEIVPDDIHEIQKAIRHWTDSEKPLNLVVTSGGTGFAVKDVTPEAVEPLLHKQASGLVHGMFSSSINVTPFAIMARLVAGVRNQSIIVTVPGSPKGARENLEAILKLLPHACQQAAGADSRALHAGGVGKLEDDAGVRSSGPSKPVPAKGGDKPELPKPSQHGSCGHDHDTATPKTNGSHSSTNGVSNNPEDGAADRHRKSPYPLVSVEDALKTILEKTPSPETDFADVDNSLVGYVLAEDIKAQEPVPAFRASIVDGYAIAAKKGKSIKGVYPVVAVSHAAPGKIKPLEHGQVARITTGAPLPAGATAVVMVEDTKVKTRCKNGKEEKEIEILANHIEIGENIREIGSDIADGESVLYKGETITAVGGELGLLASVGMTGVLVYKRPVVGVLSTGDEVVDPSTEELKTGQVRDTNRITILSVIQSAGFPVVDLGIARDTSDSLETALRDAMRRVDVVVTSGGVSMGELDLLKPTIERKLGGHIHFGRVNMKPGKPTTFATVPFKDNTGGRRQKLIFALPGNPASAITTTNLFVLPSIQKASGYAKHGVPRMKVTLEESIKIDPERPEFHRAILSVNSKGHIAARSTGGQRSSRIKSFKTANGLIAAPADGRTSLPKGAEVEALLIGSLSLA